MKNVFAIGAERDGTHRHAQCVISNRERCSPWNIGLEPCVPVPATRNTKFSKPSIVRARLCRAEEDSGGSAERRPTDNVSRERSVYRTPLNAKTRARP